MGLYISNKRSGPLLAKLIIESEISAKHLDWQPLNTFVGFEWSINYKVCFDIFSVL